MLANKHERVFSTLASVATAYEAVGSFVVRCSKLLVSDVMDCDASTIYKEGRHRVACSSYI